MLLLLNNYHQQINAFTNDKALYNTIEHWEKVRYANRTSKRKSESWLFTQYSLDRMDAIYQYMLGKQVAADEPKTDVLQVLEGDPTRSRFIPVTPGLDVESLRIEWCKRYCCAHGYDLIEIVDILDFRKASNGLND